MTIPRNDEIFHGDTCKVQDHIDTLLIECQCHDRVSTKCYRNAVRKIHWGRLKRAPLRK